MLTTDTHTGLYKAVVKLSHDITQTTKSTKHKEMKDNYSLHCNMLHYYSVIINPVLLDKQNTKIVRNVVSSAVNNVKDVEASLCRE